MICPECGAEMIPTTSMGRLQVDVWQCPVHPECIRPRLGAKAPVALKLPHLDPGKQSRFVNVPEKHIQESIVKYLRYSGYLVLETSERRKRILCLNCKEWFMPHSGRAGVDKGLPDLYARSPKWPANLWAGIEVKGRTTEISPEQQNLASQNAITIVRSPEEALHVVKLLDRELGK